MASRTVEMATFYVGEALCGMDILNVQEINKLMDMTTVPQAPDYVMGILNLTWPDRNHHRPGKKAQSGKNRIERDEPEYHRQVPPRTSISDLLVSRISDVVEAQWDKVEPPPANIGGVTGQITFKGVFKTKERLIGILDVEKVLENDN
jgi:purine-binding chemotaxis protein CheW